MVDERCPGAVGANVTETVQEAPDARAPLQVVVSLKSPGFAPPLVIDEMVSAEVPGFMTVTTVVLLTVPVIVDAKLTGSGEIVIAGMGFLLPQPPVMMTRKKRKRNPRRTSQDNCFGTSKHSAGDGLEIVFGVLPQSLAKPCIDFVVQFAETG